jgi:hypothetical protein
LIKLLDYKKMNKKGQFEAARKTIFWLIMGFIITMIIIAYAILLAGYRNKLTYTPPDMKAEFIALRFSNIPECFAYQEPLTERVYAGSIDLTKFNKGQMDECYFTNKDEGHKDYNFGLTLVKKDLFVATNNYLDQDVFVLEKKVMVWDGTKFEADTLQIKVQVRLGAPST